MLNDALITIRKFVRAIEDLQIDYYIGGSIASIVYGFARTTRDVDVILTLSSPEVAGFVQRVERDFYVDAAAVERGVSTGTCFNAIDSETIFQVDVFTPLTNDWIRSQFIRRQLHQIGIGNEPLNVFLVSPEDVILNKLNWFRLGNEISRLQWEDAVGVISVQRGVLDEAYLAEWANRLELENLLAQAYDAAAK